MFAIETTVLFYMTIYDKCQFLSELQNKLVFEHRLKKKYLPGGVPSDVPAQDRCPLASDQPGRGSLWTQAAHAPSARLPPSAAVGGAARRAGHPTGGGAFPDQAAVTAELACAWAEGKLRGKSKQAWTHEEHVETGTEVGGGDARRRGFLSLIREFVTGPLWPQEGVTWVGQGDGNTQPGLFFLTQIKTQSAGN